jgi:streptogramin lyase
MHIRWGQALLLFSIPITTFALQQPAGFDHFSLQHGLSQNSVTCVLQDRQGFLWIGTTDGLNRYDGNGFAVFRRNPHDTSSIADNCILSICADPGGDIWLGTYNAGLIRYAVQENRFIRCRSIDPFLESGKTGITAIHIDSSGFVWIGSYGTRLLRYNPRSSLCTSYTYADTTLNACINVIAEDSSGILWLGTNGEGLLAFNVEARLFRSYRYNEQDPLGLCGDFVYALSVDRRGHLWIGTEAGLCHLEEGRFQTYRNDALNGNSLSSNHVTAITEDYDGRIWIGTADRGLNCLDPSARTFVAYHYTPEEYRSLNSNAISCVARDRSGVIWIGTFGGGINKLVQSNVPGYLPPLVITSVKVSGHDIAPPHALSMTEQITLSYPGNSFSCEFALLDFRSPEANQYAYMLEGADRGWVKSGTQRFAQYTNLDDGEYTLRIKGANADGLWNEAGRTLRISVLPPFWRQWWFSPLSGAVILLCLAMVHRYRVSRLLEIERTRNRIARDLHDEVGSTLSSISYFADAIRRDAEVADASNTGRLLALISESSVSARDAMSDIVWAIDPSNDCWEKVAAKLRRFASDLFESKGIAYSIHIPATAPFTFPSIEHRRNFWLLFKEMVTNAAKHSQCTTVQIDLSVDNQSYHMLIVDNGIGFDPAGVSPGNGLNNMQTRAGILGANLHLQTSPEQGTRWELNYRPPDKTHGYVMTLRERFVKIFR